MATNNSNSTTTEYGVAIFHLVGTNWVIVTIDGMGPTSCSEASQNGMPTSVYDTLSAKLGLTDSNAPEPANTLTAPAPTQPAYVAPAKRDHPRPSTRATPTPWPIKLTPP